MKTTTGPRYPFTPSPVFGGGKVNWDPSLPSPHFLCKKRCIWIERQKICPSTTMLGRSIIKKIGCPTVPLTELFTVWDHFPIHHFRSNNRPIIAIGHKPQKHLITQKLQHPNNIKKALYYQELLEKGYVQSQRTLAQQVGISQTKVHLILQLLKLDEEIKDFILKIDDSDPRLDFLAVYRLQPLLRVKSKARQRKKFWQMIEEQCPGQSACYKQVAPV